MGTTPHRDAGKPATSYRIRHRDTGGVRELTPAQWKKDAKALTDEGFVRVDEQDQPVADDDGKDD